MTFPSSTQLLLFITPVCLSTGEGGLPQCMLEYHTPTPREQTTPPPADGYCCGRYASYWNTFLLLIGDPPPPYEVTMKRRFYCMLRVFILTRKQKRYRFQIDSKEIQFAVHIEQRQGSKKIFAFTLLLNFSVTQYQ